MDKELKLPVIKDVRTKKKALSMDEYMKFCEFNLSQLTDAQKQALREQKRRMAVPVKFRLLD